MSRALTPILLSFPSRAAAHAKGRIVAIETSPARARTLRRLFADGSDVMIVKSADDAIRSIIDNVPDLVLTSVFLPPEEEAAITACIRQLPAAAHLQVITIPHFIDSEEAADRTAPGVLGYLKRRSAPIRPACDPELLREHIETYLEQARAARLLTTTASIDAALSAPESRQTGLVLAPASGVSSGSTGEDRLVCWPLRADGKDRRRTRRRPLREVPWLWSVTVPWDANVAVVDVSSGGVLLETSLKITPGRTVDLRLIGQNTDITMPARTTRSEVASIDSRGARYRVAAAFARHLEISGLEPATAAGPATPTALADLLGRALRDGPGAGTPSRRFEEGLRQLLAVRDVGIRREPVIPDDGCDAIYFRVPGTAGEPVLQAIFEPGHQPSPMEFRLLKAAATLAAVVLEFAPLAEDGVRR